MTTAEPIIDLPMPMLPQGHALDDLILVSAEVHAAMQNPCGTPRQASELREAVDRAEAFRDLVILRAEELREAASPADLNTIGAELHQLVGAWPNVPDVDLSTFGRYLALDVSRRSPSRYALDVAMPRLRERCRNLPTIAETLAALDEAQRTIRAAVHRIDVLPSDLERARADLRASEDEEQRHPSPSLSKTLLGWSAPEHERAG